MCPLASTASHVLTISGTSVSQVHVVQVDDAPPKSPHALTPVAMRRFTHSASSECLTI